MRTATTAFVQGAALTGGAARGQLHGVSADGKRTSFVCATNTESGTAAAAGRRGRRGRPEAGAAGAVRMMAGGKNKNKGKNGEATRLSDAQLEEMLNSELNRGMVVAGGFTDFAELLNGRAAMIGFIAALGIELATGRGLVPIVTDLLGQ